MMTRTVVTTMLAIDPVIEGFRGRQNSRGRIPSRSKPTRERGSAAPSRHRSRAAPVPEQRQKSRLPRSQSRAPPECSP